MGNPVRKSKNIFFETELPETRIFNVTAPLEKFGRVGGNSVKKFAEQCSGKLVFFLCIPSVKSEACSIGSVSVKAPQRVAPCVNRAGVEVFFLVYPASAFDWFVSSGLMPESCCAEFEITPQILRLLDDLKSCCKNISAPGTADKTDMIALRLITEIVMQNAPELDLRRGTVRTLALAIDRDPLAEVDLKAAAASLGVSLRTFFRYWQQEFTESPVSYQLRRRLEVAARYLRCSDLDMPAVAEKSGFSTAGYFSRMFKKYNGKTPNEYRRNCRLNGGREK